MEKLYRNVYQFYFVTNIQETSSVEMEVWMGKSPQTVCICLLAPPGGANMLLIELSA